MVRNTIRSRIRHRLIVATAVVVTATGVAGTLTLAPVLAKSEPANSNIATVARDSFADLIEAVSPAVVAISTSGNAMSGERHAPDFQLPPGSPFEDYFKRFFEGPNFHGQGRENLPPRRYAAQGSGFVIDPNGTVITNYHVIKDSGEITVITNAGKQYQAELKGYDEKTDLAVLQIDVDETLPYVEFGDSDSARVGDWVIAIGNPFGLGGSATTGIISARGRDINAGPLDDFLQIDAPINRGNSGGPLFNAAGKVIGVNTAIYSPNGGNVGIGFAIPSSMASSVVDQLIAKGHVDRGWLGVQIQSLSSDLAESLGMQTEDGALIASVVEDSPADKAGLKVGDVILKFNGAEVARMRDLPRIVADTPADSKVQIEVWRDGRNKKLKATVARSQTENSMQLANVNKPSGKKLGLVLMELNDEARNQYRIGGDTDGVLVVRVVPNSPAAKKGLRPGDVIKMVGNSAVSKPGEVIAEVKKASARDRKSVLLLVERNGNDRFVAVGIA